MNWDAISAISEALGSTAVLATLAYLAVQVRHARDEARRSVRHSRLDAARQLATQSVENERLNALMTKAMVALGAPPSPFLHSLMETAGLTREEATTLQNHQAVWWLFRVQVIAHIEHLPPEERAEFDDMTRSVYRGNPLSSLWYQSAKEGLVNRHAVRYIDNLLAQSD
jgi:hypothetical protein